MWFLITEDFLAVYPVDNFFISLDFDLDLHPLVGWNSWSGRLHDMLSDEFAVHFKIGAGGADVAGRTPAFPLVSKELKLKADWEALVEAHALGWLGVNHDAAV